MSALATGIGCAKSFNPDDNREKDRRSNNLKFDSHDCTQNKFYKERKAYFRCGVSPCYVKSGKHKCDWRRGKM